MRSGIIELCTYFVFGELPEFSKSANSDVCSIIEYIPKTFEFRREKKICLLMYLNKEDKKILRAASIQAAGRGLGSPDSMHIISSYYRFTTHKQQEYAISAKDSRQVTKFGFDKYRCRPKWAVVRGDNPSVRLSVRGLPQRFLVQCNSQNLAAVKFVTKASQWRKIGTRRRRSKGRGTKSRVEDAACACNPPGVGRPPPAVGSVDPGHTFDSDPVSALVFNPSSVLNFDPGLTFDFNSGFVLDSNFCPAFNSDYATNHSSNILLEHVIVFYE
ncbi:hypothetical protein EVAR_77739_1 [Eumeta japonica]|uniref:Uncharacterized protein n=1 Tax=Eumeta variegata TaxID=151549 RepID=A0A4C1TBU1_EUMVA|nr:hypothetical protein EVAR_77739_1 [Eumeta japonica]